MKFKINWEDIFEIIRNAALTVFVIILLGIAIFMFLPPIDKLILLLRIMNFVQWVISLWGS